MITVVVPLDGSDFAERALRPGCSLAARLPEARLLLVGCVSDDAEAVQRHLADRAGLFAGVVDVDTRIIECADPAEGIVQAIAATDDSLLCMATHGRGGLRSAVVGSVAQQVLSRAPEPLLLVGPSCRTSLLPGERARMLVCSDGSPFADAVLPVAASWAARLELEPWVAEVVPPDEAVAPAGRSARNREVEAAAQRLEALAAQLENERTSARTEVLHGTPTSRAITRFAEGLPAGLIAMATHGRAGLVRAGLGSVTAEVVRDAPCPVLVTRPVEEPSGSERA